MTQEYTPVAWQDETTSQQGTLINAERLNQMQQAHHFADGLEEVDAIPTADPGVEYHKIVYCTADSTIYRWDGTAWTADIDDETKRLLEQEIARATAAEGGLRGQLEDEHDARVDAEAAINDRITDEATELAQRIATETSTRYTADTALGTRITNETSARESADTALGNRITAEATARAEADTALGGRIDTEQARAEAAEQANAQAIANTYTKAEIDTALGAKADKATTYTKSEVNTALALKADKSDTYTKAEVQTYVSNALDGYLPMVRTTGNQIIAGNKTFTDRAFFKFPLNSIAQTICTDVAYSSGSQNSPLIDLCPSNTQVSVGRIYSQQYGTDEGMVGMEIYTPTTGYKGGLYLRGDPSGAYAQVPTRGYHPSFTEDIATIGTLDAYTPMVRTTGNQDIAGVKTFTGNELKVSGDWARIRVLATNADVTGGVKVDDATSLYFVDKNNVLMGQIRLLLYADGHVLLQAVARNANGTNKYATLVQGDAA